MHRHLLIIKSTEIFDEDAFRNFKSARLYRSSPRALLFDLLQERRVDVDAVIAAIFLSLLSIIITLFIMPRKDESKNTQTHGGHYNPQCQEIKVDDHYKLALGREMKRGGSSTIEPSYENHILDKSKAQPTQLQDNSKNTQTGGGYYNPQAQAIEVGRRGELTLGPEIKSGGSCTINPSSEKQGNGPTNKVEPTKGTQNTQTGGPTKGTQNTQTGGGLYNPQLQASTIRSTVSLGPVIDENGSFKLNKDKSQAQPTLLQDNRKNTQTHGSHYNPQRRAIKREGHGKLTLEPEMERGGSSTIEPEKHILDKSKAQPTQTSGGYYNPQAQAIEVGSSGKLTLGPKIKRGGSCTINPSSEKQVLGNGPTNEVEPTKGTQNTQTGGPTKGTQNTQTGGGLYNPQLQASTIRGTVSLGPVIDKNGSFNL